MESIPQELIKYGGSAGVIVAIAYLLSRILPLLGINRSSMVSKQLDNLIDNHITHFQDSMDTLVEYAKKQDERSEKTLLAITDMTVTLRERK